MFRRSFRLSVGLLAIAATAASALLAAPVHAATGTPLPYVWTTSLSTTSGPTSATPGANGMLVALRNEGRVVSIDPATGAQTTIVDGLTLPQALLVDDAGNFYVVLQTGGTNVLEYSPTGAPLRSWSIPGTGGFAIAQDAAGRLYISEQATNAIYVFDSDGTRVATWTSGVTAPLGVAVGADGAVYYTASRDTAVHELAADGTPVGTFPVGDASVGLAVSPEGTLLVAGTGTIREFTTDGTLVNSTGTLGSGENQFSRSLNQLTVAGHDLFVTDFANARVAQLTRYSEPSVITSTLADAAIGSAYTQTLERSGWPAPTVAVTGGALPDGLALDGTTGEISGRPTTAGAYVFTVTASNAIGSAVRDLSITVPDLLFTTGAAATVSGAAQAGGSLHVEAGTIAPTPDSVHYVWTVGGVPAGTDSADLPLTDAMVGATVSVTVTADRANFATTTATATAGPVRARDQPRTSVTSVAAPAALPAAKLTVRAPARGVIGERIRVTASGLAAGETYTVRVGGTKVATGHASAAGTVSAKVSVPKRLTAGTRKVAVVGSVATRKGVDTVKLATLRSIRVAVADTHVAASTTTSIVVRRLLPGEKVTVVYNGHRVSPKNATASTAGVYRLSFDTGEAWGWRTLEVTGGHDGRSTKAHVTVGPFEG